MNLARKANGRKLLRSSGGREKTVLLKAFPPLAIGWMPTMDVSKVVSSCFRMALNHSKGK